MTLILEYSGEALEWMKLKKFYGHTFKDSLLLLNTRPVSWLDDTWILEVWKFGEVKPNPDGFGKTCLLANCMNVWTGTGQ
jgi:hypothetical protein